jgi:hypothetical protein
MRIIHSDEQSPSLKEHKDHVTLAWINAPAGNHDIPAYCLEYYAQEQNSYTYQNGVEV